MLMIDLDDTLIRTSVHYREAEERLVAVLGEQVRPWLPTVSHRIRKHLRHPYGPDHLDAVADVLAALVGAEPPPVGDLVRQAPHPLLPGVKLALHALVIRGEPMVIWTRGELGHQCEKVHRHQLDQFFGEIIVVPTKDVPTLDATLVARGWDPEDVTIIGDSLSADIAPGVALGCRTVHLTQCEHTWEPPPADAPEPTASCAMFRDVPFVLDTIDLMQLQRKGREARA